MIRSAILLAAGRGKRQRPFTDTIPKPLLPARGRPTLDYVLLALQAAGVQRVCIVTHHLEEQIFAFAGDGSKWGLELAYAHQSELRGSGDALMSVPADWIPDEAVMVAATDYILAEHTLRELVQAHERSGADITISIKECPIEEFSSRSSVEVDTQWQVKRIVEKPARQEILSPYAASVLFIFPPAIWKYLPRLRPAPRGELEIQSAVQLMIDDGYRVHALLQPIPEEWSAPSNPEPRTSPSPETS